MDLPPVFSDRRALEVVVCDADHLLDNAGYAVLAQSYNSPEERAEQLLARAIYVERTETPSDGE
jgi:hypothetical protein